MKSNLLLILVIISLYSCKSDKKEPIIEPEPIIVEDTIPAVEIDSIPLLVEDSIPVIEEVEENKTQEKVPDTKPKTPKIAENFLIESDIKISPIEHGTLVISYNNYQIYIDPVGGSEAFKGYGPPNFILITDIHGDHLNVETIEAIKTANTIIIGPKAVKEKLPTSLHANFTTLFSGLSRGFSTSKMSLDIEGVAMYNVREEAKHFHPKGRGLGYILNINGKRIYVSGDTEDTFEMRHLKNIDIALICMNLPYTMPVESAASAVLEFKPKKVLPYHYRGTDGLSDVNRFKTLVNNGNSRIKVVQLQWYN